MSAAFYEAENENDEPRLLQCKPLPWVMLRIPTEETRNKN